MVAVAKATEDLYAQDRPGLRGDLIKAAVDNLRSHASACQAILVLSKLMESHPAAALTERLIGRRELLDQIWEEGNILELGVSDALHFIRASRSGRFTHSDLGSGAAPSIASDAAAAGASEAAPPSLPAARSLSRGSSIRAQREAPTSVFTALPMLEQLRTRLRFITLAARLSGQGLPIVQVGELFGELVKEGSNAEERNLFFEWVEEAAQQVSEAHFQCLKALFRAINTASKAILPCEGGAFEVQKRELEGEGALWAVAFHAADDSISSVALEWMSTLRGNLAPELADASSVLMRNQVSQVLSELEGAQAEGDQRLVKRCLEALDSLLRNSEALASKGITPHLRPANGRRIRVDIVNSAAIDSKKMVSVLSAARLHREREAAGELFTDDSSDERIEFQLDILNTEPLWQLREAVAAKLQCRSDQCHLWVLLLEDGINTVGGRNVQQISLPLDQGCMPLCRLGLYDGAVVE
ncbi:unnamed protein product, partial [Symbiodinium sp. KB8]